ncbi:MAG: hypothetical protein EZS28_016076 [Streblomastix strix]|uniref:Uncharacterized protein n=1 Tax=Streblomastix strix TaxID=222440 RepID=A0A5J4W0J1_9EUKA|nr:MAG: hypothetical protein EZS28_016076 [Streblomastix strix]
MILAVPKASSVPQIRPQEFLQQLAEICAQEQSDRETDADITRLLVYNLHIEKNQFNPVRYKQRNNFYAELGKVHWLKQNVWKTVVIKRQSKGEHYEFCNRLLKTLMAMQCTLLATIHNHLQNKPIGNNLFHILKLVNQATDDAQIIKEGRYLPKEDKHLIEGLIKSSEVLFEETKSQLEEQENVKLAENFTTLLKSMGKIGTGTTLNPEGNRNFRQQNRQQQKKQ